MADFKQAFAPDIVDQINADTAFKAALAQRSPDVSPVPPEWLFPPVQVDAYEALGRDPFAATTERLRQLSVHNPDARTRDYPRAVAEADPAAEANAAREAAARRLAVVVNPRRPSELSPELTSKLAAAGASAADPFGIPSWAVGLVSPRAKEAWRETYEGEPIAAMVGSFATPGAAVNAPVKAAAALGRAAVKYAPSTTTAALAAILGLSPTEAEPRERRRGSERQKASDRDYEERLRLKRERDEIEATMPDAATLEAMGFTPETWLGATAAEREGARRGLVARSIEVQEAARRAEEENRKANAPLSERHPWLLNALTYGPGLLAFRAGARATRRRQDHASELNKDLAERTTKAESIADAGGRVPIYLRRQIQEGEKMLPAAEHAAESVPWPTVGRSTALGALAPALPYGFELAHSKEGSEAKREARRAFDPTGRDFWERSGVGALEAFTLGLLGSEAAAHRAGAPSPALRSMGFIPKPKGR